METQITVTTGRPMPRIAAYHCGPYSVAAILQDPGTIHANGCNAQKTGEVGVLNGDPTATLLKAALEANTYAIHEYLPLNAIPWFDAPKSKPNELIKEGAAHNRALILKFRIHLVILLGSVAHRSERFLNLPNDVEIRRLPHPGRLGLINYRENGVRVGAARARQRIIEGFAR